MQAVPHCDPGSYDRGLIRAWTPLPSERRFQSIRKELKFPTR